MNSPLEISIVICVFNEEENIAPLLKKVRAAMQGLSYEIIVVDDGSSDKTLDELRRFLSADMEVIEMRKNYGQSLALSAGIAAASGKYISTMDGDLQNDPNDIPEMLRIAKEGGWDLVAGYRENRQDKVLLRKIPSKIAGFLIRKSLNIRVRDFGCTLRLYRSEIAKDLNLYGELHRFISALAYMDGARIVEVPVKHHPRIHGKSKYGLGRTVRVVSDLLLMLFFKRYLQRPMHLFGSVGLVLFIIGALINLYLLILKIGGADIWGKPLLLLGITLLLAGMQLITLGIFVELQMRTYYESQEKKPYKIRKVYHEQEVVSKDY